MFSFSSSRNDESFGFYLNFVKSASHNTVPPCDRAASIITFWKLSSRLFAPTSIDDCRSRGNMVCIEVPGCIEGVLCYQNSLDQELQPEFFQTVLY